MTYASLGVIRDWKRGRMDFGEQLSLSNVGFQRSPAGILLPKPFIHPSFHADERGCQPSAIGPRGPVNIASCGKIELGHSGPR